MRLLCLLRTTQYGAVGTLSVSLRVNLTAVSVTISLPANTDFQYKYIRKYSDAVTWEADPNNVNTTPAHGAYTIKDTWRW